MDITQFVMAYGAMLPACDDKSAENAAAIPCRQVRGASSVSFPRQD